MSELFQPTDLKDLPEVMFIQVLPCPGCRRDVRIAVPAKPPLGSDNVTLNGKCTCGKRIQAWRASDGSYGFVEIACCFVVTETFGESSRELTRTQRRCRQVFQTSLFRQPYAFYQQVGPMVASWASSSVFARAIVKSFLARPIVWAAQRRRWRSRLAQAYLLALYVALHPILSWTRESRAQSSNRISVKVRNARGLASWSRLT